MAPPSKDQEKDWEPIINAVQPHEFLYNPQLPDYMDKDKKNRKWTEIGLLLDPPVDGPAAYKQWKSVKDMYDKKKREAAKKKSGDAADEYLKKWAWAGHLSFLDRVKVVAEPHTNMAPPLQLQPGGSGTQQSNASNDELSQKATGLSQFPPSPAVGRKRSGRRDDDNVQDLAKEGAFESERETRAAFAELIVARLDELEKLTSSTCREYCEGRILNVIAETKADALNSGQFRDVSDTPSTVDNEVHVLPPTQQQFDTLTNFKP